MWVACLQTGYPHCHEVELKKLFLNTQNPKERSLWRAQKKSLLVNYFGNHIKRLLIHKTPDTLLWRLLELLATYLGISNLTVRSKFRIKSEHVGIDEFFELLISETISLTCIVVSNDKRHKCILTANNK